MPPKKIAYRKRPRKSYVPRPMKRRTPALRDGQTVICAAYFECRKTCTAQEDHLGWSIKLDPKAAILTQGDANTTFADGTSGAGAAIASGAALSFAKYNTFSAIYNQYRINSISSIVRVSTAGLENSLITANDIGDNSVTDTMKKALSSAHKSHSLNPNKREARYKLKNSGRQSDWLSTSPGQNQVDADARYLKIFQKIPGDATTPVVEHQIQVIMSISFKDSKNLN